MTEFINDLLLGKRVGQLHVIFQIPDSYNSNTFGTIAPPGHLAYVEWFSRPRHRDKIHGMFPVSHSYRQNGDRDASVVELHNVLRPCMLFPKFDLKVNRAWTSDNVLERCKKFFLNHYGDQNIFQTAF